VRCSHCPTGAINVRPSDDEALGLGCGGPTSPCSDARDRSSTSGSRIPPGAIDCLARVLAGDGRGATYAFNAPDLASTSQENVGKEDCGNGPAPGGPPQVITCTGVSATADGRGYWIGESAHFVANGMVQYAVVGIPQGAVGTSAAFDCAGGPVSAGAYLPTPTSGIAAAPIGVWLATADGGVFASCGAEFHGSMGGARLNQAIVAIAASSDGGGYWEVAADGGVFAFGDAGFYGSMADAHLNKPIVGMAVTRDGKGYWLVASDGGVFSFGDAQFGGSMGDKPLSAPMTGIAEDPDGIGYWTVAADGGVFAFGGAPFLGSEGGQPLDAAVVGIASRG
jgi:hypothetical protein